MKSHYSYFVRTHDNERLFVMTNFRPNEWSKMGKVPLVFNYGLVCNFAHWQYQSEYFDSLDYPVIYYDLRGHFQSSGAEKIENCTFEIFAQDLKSILDFFEISRCLMLGHSMGVNVTLEFARRYHNYLCGMVLISGTVLPPEGLMFNSNAFQYFTVAWKWLMKNFPQFHEKLWISTGQNPLLVEIVRQGGFNVKKTHREFVEVYMNRIGKLRPELFFQCLKQMNEHDMINHLEAIQTPALIMGGDKDNIIPHHVQFILNEHLPQSEIYIVKEGSHVPQVDFPDSINQRIELFIVKLPYHLEKLTQA